jgi:hypothetical protein
MSTILTSGSAQEVFPRNTLRKSFVIQNEDAADAVYIKRERSGGLTVSSTDHDHRIGPGGLISVNNLTDGTESIQDRWTVIAAANTPRVSFFETEDVQR